MIFGAMQSLISKKILQYFHTLPVKAHNIFSLILIYKLISKAMEC